MTPSASRDSLMRNIVDRKGFNRTPALTSQMEWFETEWLATDSNHVALSELSGVLFDRVQDCRPPKMIILDMVKQLWPDLRQ